jgi:Beta-1,3-glucanase
VPFRVISPYHGIENKIFKTNQDPNNVDKYISDVWDNYSVGKPSLTTKPSTDQLFGNTTSSAGNFAFRKGSATGSIVFQIPKPNAETLYQNELGRTVLGPDGNKLNPLTTDAEQTARDLGAQFMRSTLLVDSTLQQESTPCSKAFIGKFYQNIPKNLYAKFWHDNSINGLAYGFGYDDTCKQSGILFVDNPTGLSITLGGIPSP